MPQQELISDILGRHAAEIGYASLPPEEIAAAKESLIDTLAVAVGARHAPGTAQVLDVARREGSAGASTVWDTGERMSARNAGFVNSVYAAALDYDSLHHLAVAHSDIVVVPTAVAVAEAAGASGRELLAATALACCGALSQPAIQLQQRAIQHAGPVGELFGREPFFRAVASSP